MGAKSTRDGRRQSRLVKGDDAGLSVHTINHHKGGELRLDVTIKYKPGGEDVIEAHGHEDYNHDRWFSAFAPQPDDGCYVQNPNGVILDSSGGAAGGPNGTAQKVCWFHLDDKVLGVHEGQVVEYDAETLSPLGIVLDRDQLAGREVVVADGEVLMLLSSLDDLNEATTATDFEIVHPNEDGSFWRKFQKNKLVVRVCVFVCVFYVKADPSDSPITHTHTNNDTSGSRRRSARSWRRRGSSATSSDRARAKLCTNI